MSATDTSGPGAEAFCTSESLKKTQRAPLAVPVSTRQGQCDRLRLTSRGRKPDTCPPDPVHMAGRASDPALPPSQGRERPRPSGS